MKKKKIKCLEPKKKIGLVVVFTGAGKGKTSAALGIVLRCTGHDMKACIIEFIKGDLYSGEIDGLRKLSPQIELHIMGKGFCGIKGDSYTHKQHRKKAQEAVKLAEKRMYAGDFDILVLDEINVALTLKLVDLAQIVELIEKKPPLMHLILTGRGAHPKIIKKADIVTEMKEIKHAFRKGIEPQKGIDF
jgi:cob(I)alamin adenosyltransferase